MALVRERWLAASVQVDLRGVLTQLWASLRAHLKGQGQHLQRSLGGADVGREVVTVFSKSSTWKCHRKGGSNAGPFIATSRETGGKIF